MNEFLVTFRETLEAALIVGIVYTCLDKAGNTTEKKYLWWGVASALLASIIVGLGLEAIRSSLDSEAYTALFEGLMMYAAGSCLIYMIIWMSRNTQIAKELTNKTQAALATTQAGWGIFMLVFFAIIREGFETAVFLFASDTMQGATNYVSALGGILVASVLGFLIFQQGRKIPLKNFFNVSSALLIFLAAGMFAYGTHELEEFLTDTKQINKEAIPRVWDILKPTKSLPEGANESFYTEKDGKFIHYLHDKGSIGVYLKGFFGYNSDPNWAEVILWSGTIATGFYLWRTGVNAKKSLPAR